MVATKMWNENVQTGVNNNAVDVGHGYNDHGNDDTMTKMSG